jgi:DNA repair exonuclease SbcCD ATPase subunit
LEDLKRDLEKFQSDKNNLIKEINQFVEDKNKIPEISFDEQIQKIDSLNEYYKNEKENKEVENDKIRENFINKGISGDITTLLEQTKKYQEDIDALENEKKLVEDKEKNLKEKFDKIKEVIDEISKSYENFEEDIKNKWSNLKEGKESWTEKQKELVNELLKDIDIEVVERFDKDKFYEKIQETLNLSKFRATTIKSQNERIKEFFNINSKENFILFLKNEKKILSNEGEMNLSELINSEYFVKDGAKEFLRLMLLNYSDFWQVITKPKYKNKELSQLSVGMKGTMYLCLKLATDPFMKPFIFDQPEDDLDNNFIVNELVPIFKKIKKYRQVIIVTHNANLVVNADAEQVIVAENENESINYITGSLENINIRNKVCEILEGGIDAFRKRERKYNIKI